MGQGEKSHLDVTDDEIVVLVFFYQGFRVTVTARSVGVGKLVVFDIGCSLGIGKRVFHHFDVERPLLHTHLVFVEPGSVFAFLDFEIVRNRCADNYGIAAHRRADFVTADSVGNVFIKVVRNMNRDVQLFAEIVQVLAAQVELHGYTVG